MMGQLYVLLLAYLSEIPIPLHFAFTLSGHTFPPLMPSKPTNWCMQTSIKRPHTAHLSRRTIPWDKHFLEQVTLTSFLCIHCKPVNQ